MRILTQALYDLAAADDDLSCSNAPNDQDEDCRGDAIQAESSCAVGTCDADESRSPSTPIQEPGSEEIAAPTLSPIKCDHRGGKLKPRIAVGRILLLVTSSLADDVHFEGLRDSLHRFACRGPGGPGRKVLIVDGIAQVTTGDTPVIAAGTRRLSTRIRPVVDLAEASKRMVSPGVDEIPWRMTPCGQSKPSLTAVVDFLGQCRRQYVWTVFGVVPWASVEGSVLAERCDAAYVVAQTGVTQYRAARSLIHRMRIAGLNVAGCVVMDAPSSSVA